ncbi:MAG: hypothetical protein KF817_01205 [Phycisphaeraceae bacterium]|nr:hypothetical protein [Phycisphaeraceae bacterium]
MTRTPPSETKSGPQSRIQIESVLMMNGTIRPGSAPAAVMYWSASVRIAAVADITRMSASPSFMIHADIWSRMSFHASDPRQDIMMACTGSNSAGARRGPESGPVVPADRDDRFSAEVRPRRRGQAPGQRVLCDRGGSGGAART